MQPFGMDNKDETINQRIARYRRFAGLNQSQMAELLGIKPSTYSQHERCGVINCDFLISVAKILHINPTVLLLGEEKYDEPIEPIRQLSNQEQALIDIVRGMKKKYRNLALEVVYALSKAK